MLLRYAHQAHGELLQLREFLLERLGIGFKRFELLGLFYVGKNILHEQHGGLSVFEHYFTAEQIHTVYGGGAFVQGMYAGFAEEQLGHKLFGKAVATKNLQRGAGGLYAHFGRIRFYDGREQFEFEEIVFGFFTGRCFGLVEIHAGLQLERQRSFYHCFLEQEHALYIGMMDNRNLRFKRVFLGKFTTLQTHIGVV